MISFTTVPTPLTEETIVKLNTLIQLMTNAGKVDSNAMNPKDFNDHKDIQALKVFLKGNLDVLEVLKDPKHKFLFAEIMLHAKIKSTHLIIQSFCSLLGLMNEKKEYNIHYEFGNLVKNEEFKRICLFQDKVFVEKSETDSKLVHVTAVDVPTKVTRKPPGV